MHHSKHVQLSDRTILLSIAAILTGLGLLSVYASSAVKSFHETGNHFSYSIKQITVAIVGFVAAFSIGHIPLRWLERVVLPLLVVSLLALAAVSFTPLGIEQGGAKRWLNLVYFTIQPSELAKLSCVFFLARNLSRPSANIDSFWSGIFPSVVVIGAFAALLMVQPDFGSTVVLLILGFAMFVLGGLSKRRIMFVSFVGIAAISALVLTANYRIRRVLSFLDPWGQIDSGGYQIIQSFLGFQSGGFWGLGLGESRQKLYYLPEAHTDFILSVIGEELGLMGVLLVILSFLFILWIGISVASRLKKPYHRYLAYGLTMLICLQAVLNVGVTMGLLPTKGLTLPFLSRGTNSLIVSLVSIGVLARLSELTEARRFPIRESEPGVTVKSTQGNFAV